ncbi:MAG TPA: ATP-binding cassette domain-containing protein [Alphaproteobacteria bacterium]|nr:ATP-binding cassette domain-containing protein [Alphaproteobacteria bacterium]
MGAVVRFENVGLRYGLGPEVLRDITFALEPGSFHFLVGPSGAGKSSLLSLLYLARRPSRGMVSLFDRDIATTPRNELPALRRKIGVVFQDFALLAHLSAFENVALPLRVCRTRDAEIQSHVRELLIWVGLGEHLEARPATLSGGQKQRVAIARALINRPSLLVADEPTGSLDDALGMRLLYLFEALNRIGTTVLIATHNRNLVARFNHPLLRLADGTLAVDEGRRAAVS